MKIAALLAAVAALVLLPMVVRPNRPTMPEGALELIIITPHNEQIRSEFGPAFDRWHREAYGEPVNVIFNVPGGTSEIRKMLESQAIAALRSGREVGGGADLVFGGGSYEHDKFKSGVTVTVDGEKLTASLSMPVAFPDAWLSSIYGENIVGDQHLYDPEKHWFGLALSGFGIVFNNDLLRESGVPKPTSWDDLCHRELRGQVALVNPGQSGSVTTAFEAILQRRGWETGWQILRRTGANSRYFSASSLKPPIDVSRGDAAMGVCIDFYGRYQSQAIIAAGGGDRVGYIDPPGETNIDPDPISMLVNPPHEETAKRFIEFCLTEYGQALWQFHLNDEDDMGPERFELRRMPVLRRMYARYMDRMVDQIDPFEIARPIENYNRAYRSFIAVVFTSMVMDSHNELRDAWDAIVTHPAYPDGQPLTTAEQVTDPNLKEMLEIFDAMPDIPVPGGTESLGNVDKLPELKAGWLRDGWVDEGLWNKNDRAPEALRRLLSDAFKSNYRRIVELGGESAG